MSVVEAALTAGEASLRAAPALVVVLAARRFLDGRAPASLRRGLLLTAIVAVALLPAAAALLPGLPVELPGPEGLGSPRLPEAAAPAGFAVPSIGHALALVWLVGVAVMTARLVAGLVGAARRTRASRSLDDPAWLAARAEISERIGVERPPELRVTAGEDVPMAWGVLRPVILLPPSALRWSDARRRAVLAHEIGHLARREPLARIVAEVVRAVHWFDPLVRGTVERIRRESEVAADEVALSLGIDPVDYAGHLVELARARLPRPPRVVAALASSGELERRVEAILAPPAPRGGARRSVRARVGVAGLAFGLVLAMAIPRLDAGADLAGRLAARYGISVPLASEILEAAGLEGIAPGVAFGLVAEESRFDPDRVSPGGAVGLTQVLPETARKVAPGVAPGELRDVPVNLRIGFRYLRSQIDREGGDVAGGLVAYSIGPRRLDDLRRSGKPIPDDYASRILAHDPN